MNTNQIELNTWRVGGFYAERFEHFSVWYKRISFMLHVFIMIFWLKCHQLLIPVTCMRDSVKFQKKESGRRATKALRTQHKQQGFYGKIVFQKHLLSIPLPLTHLPYPLRLPPILLSTYNCGRLGSIPPHTGAHAFHREPHTHLFFTTCWGKDSAL